MFYNRIVQGLTGAPYTYCAFTDMTFGFLLLTGETPLKLSIIGDNSNTVFSPFVDDYNRLVKFDSIVKLLYKEYFLRVV